MQSRDTAVVDRLLEYGPDSISHYHKGKEHLVLQPFQQRVVEEKEQLDQRLGRLADFVDGSTTFPTLPEDEQVRLKRQLNVMREYSNILYARIACFPQVAGES